MNRRVFLRVAAVGAATGLMSACNVIGRGAASNPTVPPAGAAQGKVALPTRVPASLVQADLPGSADGLIDPAFRAYPANPPRSVTEKPGNGDSITVTTWLAQAPPTPMEQNAMWQQVNQELGLTLTMHFVPFTDYQQTRLTTMIAAGELTDVVFIAPGAVLPQFPDFLKAKAADLTPYLSGDAIKDYPNLANFPTLAWKNVVFNNAIYGVPAPYSPYLWVHWVHQELLDQAGLSAPTSADQYRQELQAVTTPQSEVWGIGIEHINQGMGLLNGHFSAIFGAPNNWRVDANGKMTHTIETDEFRQALGYARDLYASGVFNPNSLSYDTNSKRNDFTSRRFAFDFDGFQNASILFWQRASSLNPPAKYRIVPPFSADGTSKPVFWSNTGIFGYSIVPQASPDRIKEILRVLNYIAAPFGTHEHLLMHYGVEGVDFTFDGSGNPISTDQGKADTTTFPWNSITQPPATLYFPGAADYPQLMQDAEKAINPSLLADPTVGLYSDTYASKTGVLNQLLNDGLIDIVVGRTPPSGMDDLIQKWRSSGGDQSRTEFEQAYAAAQAT